MHLTQKGYMQRLFAGLTATAVSFSSLSELAMGSAWGQEVEDSKIQEYVEKLESSHELSLLRTELESLRELGSEAVPKYLRNLQSKDEKVPLTAVVVLAFMEEKAADAVPTLTQVLKEDKNAQVRRFATNALGNIGEKAADAVPTLTQALEDENTLVRRSAAYALGNIGETAAPAVPALTQALEDENTLVRRSAAYALGRIGEEAADAVPALTQVLKEDKDILVRSTAADALGRIGEEAADAVIALTQALEDKNARVRLSATNALGRIGETAADAVPALTQALENENTLVRRSAAYALGRIGEKALKIINDPKQNFTSSQKVALERSISFLKQKRDSHFHQRTLEWIAKNPCFAGAIAYLILFPTLWLILFYIRPLWLLKVDRALEPLSEYQLPDILGNVNLPIKSLLLLEPFIYRPRVLDAWVAENIEAAKEGFDKKKTVRDRNTHIPIPVILDRKTSQTKFSSYPRQT